MKNASTIGQLKQHLSLFQTSPLGLVPTMGALHEGHLSLVEKAISECPLVTVSIFVNPTQFNDKEDLKNYPRTIKEDLNLLNKVLRKDDLVFTPADTEIYPSEDKRVFSFGNLDRVMEAQHRPGHFNGVAQVVSRLFDIVNPEISYFGMKDFQQVAVIKELVRQENYKTKIKGCPIVRDSDGLAMSSRNRLLSPEIRQKAPVIFRTISEASRMLKTRDILEIKEYVKTGIESEHGFSVEYFEIVDDKELVPVQTAEEIKRNLRYFGCIAVKAGKIRLIDNIEIQLA